MWVEDELVENGNSEQPLENLKGEFQSLNLNLLKSHKNDFSEWDDDSLNNFQNELNHLNF